MTRTRNFTLKEVIALIIGYTDPRTSRPATAQALTGTLASGEIFGVHRGHRTDILLKGEDDTSDGRRLPATGELPGHAIDLASNPIDLMALRG
jgi:hypothetical protein